MPTDELSGIVYDLPDAAYHSRPELSSSGARLLLPQYKGSPKKFQWEKRHPHTSRAYDLGHAAHAKILGVGLGIIAYPDGHLTPSGNVSTKKATVEWEAEQRARGVAPVSPNEIADVNAMADAVLTHPTAGPILEVAVHREVSAFGTVDGVPCRARFDALSDDTRNGVYAVDLKSATDATYNGFTREVSKWGYDFQEAFYEDVHLAATGDRIDTFAFVVVEKNPPYEVAVFTLPELWVSMGRRKAAEARRIYQECTESGVWPGYDTKVQVLDPPAWAVIEHELTYEGGEIQV